MSDNSQKPFYIHNPSELISTIKGLGSETGFFERKIFAVVFLFAIISMIISVAYILSAFFVHLLETSLPFISNRNVYMSLMILIGGIILLLISILISESKRYEDTQIDNSQKRMLLIKYCMLSHFKNNKVSVKRKDKKLTADDLQVKINELDNSYKVSSDYLDFLKEKLSQELKQVETKKSSTFIITLIITLITSGVGLFNNAAKAVAYYSFLVDQTDALDLSKEFVECLAETFGGFISCVFFVIIILLVYSSRNGIGYVLQSRNIEYALLVIGELKTENKNKQNEELKDISIPLAAISQNLSDINQNKEFSQIMKQQNDIFLKISSSLEGINKQICKNNRQK